MNASSLRITTVKSLENKEYPCTLELVQCVKNWGLEIQFLANWNATGNSQEIKCHETDAVKIRLHQRGNLFFLEERIGSTMYPTIYKVTLKEEPELEITEEEYQNWLLNRNSK